MTKNKRVIRAKKKTIKFPYYQDCWTNISLPFTNYCLLTTNKCTTNLLQVWCNFLKDDKASRVQTMRTVLSTTPMITDTFRSSSWSCWVLRSLILWSTDSHSGWKVGDGWHPLGWFKGKELPDWAAFMDWNVRNSSGTWETNKNS